MSEVAHQQMPAEAMPAEVENQAKAEGSEEDCGLLDAEDLLLMGFALDEENFTIEDLLQHFAQFGEIASFSPLEGVTGSVVLIGYGDAESAKKAAQHDPPLVVNDRQVTIMQYEDFKNGALATDTPHEVAISGFKTDMSDDDFARLQAQCEALGKVVSWKVHNLATGSKIVRLAFADIDGVIAMFKEPFQFDGVDLFLLSEDHLSLAPQAHIVVFGGKPDPSEEDLNMLKEYFGMFGEVAQMFVRNEPEGLMLLISYMSEEAIFKLGGCEKHAPLGEPLMIQCVKSEVFDKLCSDDFQFDMEEAQDRIIVIKGLPAPNSELEKDVFEELCDTLKAALEAMAEDVHVVKIDMEPTYGLSVVEFYQTEEAMKIVGLKSINFQGGDYEIMHFPEFMLDEALPDCVKEAKEIAAAENAETAQQNEIID